MNLCINCVHHEIFPETCSHSGAFIESTHMCLALRGQQNPVSGGLIVGAYFCGAMRMGPYGIEGKMFVPITAPIADPPPKPESDAAYRDRLMGIIGPGSVNFGRLATAVGTDLDEIGNLYEGGKRK